jgi:maltooligosyltrehalose synthase
MCVARRARAARAQWRAVYEHGAVGPRSRAGGRRDCAFAFARVGIGAGAVAVRPGLGSTRGADPNGSDPDPAVAITCVPRLVASLIPEGGTPPIGREVWADTRIELPGHLARRPFRDAFTGATIAADGSGAVGTIPAATLFERFPVALLVPCSI